MKYLKLISLLCIAIIGSLLTSCEETAAVDEYANWEERNIAYIDSIAKVAEENNDGKWMKILSFKLNETDKNGNIVEWNNEDYIYCHIETKGVGTQHPIFTDSVAVNYRGRLIPYPTGKVFDQSYKGTLDPEVNKPRTFKVGGTLIGWSTALHHYRMEHSFAAHGYRRCMARIYTSQSCIR